MYMTLPGAPSITSVRARIQSLLAQETARDVARDIVILAIDGIPFALASLLWKNARVSPMQSVFPATSSAAWLSSLTGMRVAEHGIPGVVFLDDAGRLINIFSDDANIAVPAVGNVFSDAWASGYQPMAPLGDWQGLSRAWLRILLHGAEAVEGAQFYTAPVQAAPAQVGAAVLDTVRACAARRRAGRPLLVWCFIEADRHIHVHGYDEAIVDFLEYIDNLAGRIAFELDAVVIAYSDHGLVATRHAPDIDAVFGQVQREYDARLGGAGRTRWIYPRARSGQRIIAILERSLPSSVDIYPADALFEPGSLARKRVGEIVLVAQGDEFVTFGGQRYDHGSYGDGERYVPYAAWNA
jgi:hypothetical protein